MNNYKEYMNNFKNYLIAIKNLSNIYVEKMCGTIKQFLEFANTHKFNNKFETVDDISLNDIRTITNADIYNFMCLLIEEGFNPDTRNNKIDHLRTFFKYLYNLMHTLFKSPVGSISVEKKMAKKLPEYFNEKQARKLSRLYENATEYNEILAHTTINLCLNCGLRISELVNLNISEINLKENRFLIHGKGSKERMGYLNPRMKSILEKYLEIRITMKPANSKDKDALFLSTKNLRIHNDTIRQHIKKAYNKLKINNEKYGVHTLRHTFATLLLKSGSDIRVIQELMGHSDINTTKIYTHIYNKDVKESMLKSPLANFKMKDALNYEC